jgi:hypothetical protein
LAVVAVVDDSQLFILRNGGGVETETLNVLVTGAIRRAEQLEAESLSSASQVWAEVSALEEDLAKVLPVSESEGRIARRGAVRAALKAADYARAYALADRYAAEEAAPSARALTARV